MKLSFAPIMLVLLLLASCAEKNTEEQQTQLNPNGDSELALLMRQMYEDGMLVKQDIIDDNEPTIFLDHGKILTAEATNKEDVDTEVYRAFANYYLELTDQVNDPMNPNRKEAYINLVNSCIQCHRPICPGPIDRIEKLYLK